jgi:hypothetical protein
MTNIHIHHVQFDVQASDGVGTGMQFNQAVRPYRDEDPALSADAAAGSGTLRFATVPAKFRPGVWIAVGEGTERVEIRQIDMVDPVGGSVTLTKPLDNAHPQGEWAGTEFVQYRWYPDVVLDNIFFHDHVDGIHNWGHGLVGQFIVEPPGSTYHDPATGKEVDSGTFVDIHTSNPLAPGLVDGSFREQALWTIDENPATDSTFNLRAVPWADRLSGGADPSLLFSSYKHGDPNTPLPRAYTGDPFVFRTIAVGPNIDTFHVDGHRFFLENRYLDANGKVEASPVDTLHYGISEKFTLALQGGAGGLTHQPGDYLYMNGIARRFRQGAWGILRVLPRKVDGLQPLPGTSPPSGPFQLPTQTGGPPPEPSGPGTPCPAEAPQRVFNVTAVTVSGGVAGAQKAYVPTSEAAAVQNGTKSAEPLVLHVAAGECLDVRLTNGLGNGRASFHVTKLSRDIESSGVNVGFNPEQTIAPGETRTYRFFADTPKIGSALISDFGGNGSGVNGLYGAVVVGPQGATFTDPKTGQPSDIGARVDVHVPGAADYRDFTLAFADSDPIIGGSFMPYPISVSGQALVNYQSSPRADDPSMFSSAAHGDPSTPILEAYAGEPMRVHALVGPGSEQLHSFNLGGFSWHIDAALPDSNDVSTQGIGPWETVDAHVDGGAGGRAHADGDVFYGDMRRAFSEAGMWGLTRVLPGVACGSAPAAGAPVPLPCPRADPTPAPAQGGGPAPNNSGTGAASDTGSGKGGAPSSDSRGSRSDRLNPVGSGAPRQQLELRISARVSLRSLARDGLSFSLSAVPPRAGRVELRLVTKVRGRNRLVARRLQPITAAGVVRLRWRLDAPTMRGLLAGAYTLQVKLTGGQAPRDSAERSFRAA